VTLTGHAASEGAAVGRIALGAGRTRLAELSDESVRARAHLHPRRHGAPVNPQGRGVKDNVVHKANTCKKAKVSIDDRI
jgi:hypothetical protein